jgi:hypothetical protein
VWEVGMVIMVEREGGNSGREVGRVERDGRECG